MTHLQSSAQFAAIRGDFSHLLIFDHEQNAMMTRSTPDEPIMRRAELRVKSHREQIVSMPALRRHRWTADEVRRLIDERPGMSPRYELVDGELLVTPAPSG